MLIKLTLLLRACDFIFCITYSLPIMNFMIDRKMDLIVFDFRFKNVHSLVDFFD